MHPRRSFSLAVVLTTSHVLNCMGLRSARLPDPPGSPAGLAVGSGDAVEAVSNLFSEQRAAGGGSGYVVFGNHKQDSTLMAFFATILGNTFGLPFHHVYWGEVASRDDNTEPVCDASNYYEDMRVPLLMHIMETCPGMRAVRVNRRPSKLVASDYVYDKSRMPGQEEPFGPEYARKLRNMSLTDGINDVCEGFLIKHAPQALAVHQYLQTNPEHARNILEVEFDDIKDHYAATSRRIFAHWVGEDSPALDSLVSEAGYWDIHQHPEHDFGDNHVSPVDEKAQVYQEMMKEVQHGNSCIMKLKSLDKQMGYN